MEIPPDLSDPEDEPTGRQNVQKFLGGNVAVNAVYHGKVTPAGGNTEWTVFEVVAFGEQVYETDAENPNWDSWYYAKQDAIGFAKGYTEAITKPRPDEITDDKVSESE